MGGGDLNSKKSWHPNNLKNQERVWKAEQAAETERRKIAELQKERNNERTKEELTHIGRNAGTLERFGCSSKLDWMYSQPNRSGESEDYLLGKTIENNYERLLAEEKQAEIKNQLAPKNHVEHECIPFSIRNFRGQNNINPKEAQVDLARKLQEDPLMAIKKREMEARARLLQNPIKLQQLKRMLVEDKDKQKEKKSMDKIDKKKGDCDLDKLLAEKLSNIGGGKKIDIMSLLKKKKKKSKNKRAHSSESSSSDYSDSSTDSDEKKSKKKMYSKRRQSNESKKKLEHEKRKEKHHKFNQKDSSTEVKEKDFKRKHETKKKSKNNNHTINSDNESHFIIHKNKGSKSKKQGEYKNVDKEKTENDYFDRPSGSRTKTKYKKQRNVSDSSDIEENVIETRNHKRHNSDIHTWKKNKTGDSSDDINVKSNQHNLQRKDDIIRSDQSHRDRSRREEKVSFKDKHESTKDTDEHYRNKDYKNYNDRRQQVRQDNKRNKLNESEKERKLQEMMDIAVERDRERKRNVERYKAEDQREEAKNKQLDFDKEFVSKQLRKSNQVATVESRIKSNIYNIQRSKRDMHVNFARR